MFYEVPNEHSIQLISVNDVNFEKASYFMNGKKGDISCTKRLHYKSYSNQLLLERPATCSKQTSLVQRAVVIILRRFNCSKQMLFAIIRRRARVLTTCKEVCYKHYSQNSVCCLQELE